ncbi:hypothetical protein C5167_000636 [Papaver somniferum]|uniref:Mitochondrial import inner membrane translocase subunit TIM22 n=1 Tax=Papaver somniferum TaxID=3469 RepID=A0A4Y7KVY0_PAPSO|nr:uncharacterized protein LOC113313569 [Papaver somniferum]RZC76328.1 hypothetical protein C5167_000636 [Papaver somniferum]
MEGGGGATSDAVGDKERSLPAEIAIATAKNGLWGAAFGALYSRIPTKRVTLQTPLISVRNVAVLAGVYGGTMCAMREIRGKEKDDTKACMVAGFTSGFTFYLVARRPSTLRVPTAAIGVGLFFAGFNGLLHEVDGRIRGTAMEDTHVFGARKG